MEDDAGSHLIDIGDETEKTVRNLPRFYCQACYLFIEWHLELKGVIHSVVRAYQGCGSQFRRTSCMLLF